MEHQHDQWKEHPKIIPKNINSKTPKIELDGFTMQTRAAFPKNFSMKFGSKLKNMNTDAEYIYIFEAIFGKKIILFKNGTQNKFCDIAQ